MTTISLHPAAAAAGALPPAAAKLPLLPLGLAAAALLAAALFGGHPPPPAEADWLARLAAAGDHAAQLQLGIAYRDGKYGLTADAAAGLVWLRHSAAGGNAYAAALVGNAYADGVGTARNEATAEEWWRRAAAAGNAGAARRLGAALIAAGAPQQAQPWLDAAAAKGDGTAQGLLRDLYRDHRVPAGDLALGYNRFDRVAAQLDSSGLKGAAAALHLLADSSTLPQSPELLKRRAERGDPLAEYQLGLRYRDGAWDVTADPALARHWLTLAAAAGSRRAARALEEESDLAGGNRTADAGAGRPHS